MAENWTYERKQAEETIRSYKWYHAGTAATVGALGGKFGIDRIPLTALTISMITKICDIYGVTDPLPVAIHVISAIARLTYKGTLAGMALNWLPGGSLINGGVTFVLTSDCGHECMSDIEKNRMGSVEQLVLAFGRSTVTFACEAISKVNSNISSELVDWIRESMNISTPLDKVKTVISSSMTGTIMSIMDGSKLPSLREFLLSTVPFSVLNVTFTDLAQQNRSFIDNRDAVIWHLEQMQTKEPVFKAFDDQLDEWIRQARRTPDRNELNKLVNLLDNEFSDVFGCSTTGKLAGRSTAWMVASGASSVARERGFA